MDQSLEFGLRCDSPDQARWWPPWVLKQRIATRSDSDGIGMGFRLQLSFEILKGSAHLQEDEKLDDTPKSRTEIEIPSGRWTHCGHKVSQGVTTCHNTSFKTLENFENSMRSIQFHSTSRASWGRFPHKSQSSCYKRRDRWANKPFCYDDQEVDFAGECPRKVDQVGRRIQKLPMC